MRNHFFGPKLMEMISDILSLTISTLSKKHLTNLRHIYQEKRLRKMTKTNFCVWAILIKDKPKYCIYF